MSDWHTERREREQKIRDRLKANGQALLEQIREALLAKLPEGSKVATNPEAIMCSWSSTRREDMDPILSINGYPVELSIEQHHTSGGGGLGYHYNDRLAVGVNWIWVDYDIKHKSKSFGYSAKTRKSSFGFEVDKIVEYILWWVDEKKRHEALSRDAKKQKAKAEDIQDQWELARKRVAQRFDIPGNVAIEATPSGLKVTLTTDERHLETLLEAMGVKKR